MIRFLLCLLLVFLATVTQAQTNNCRVDASIQGLTIEYCASSPTAIMEGSPLGGTFTGPGVVGRQFSPTLAGPGIHTITYTGRLDTCEYVASALVIVTAEPNPVIKDLASAYCTNSTPTELVGEPMGGVFSGPGVVDNVFNPSTLQPGSYTIRYSGKIKGCTYATSRRVTINKQPNAVSAGNNSPICSGGYVGLTATTLTNATYEWRGPANFYDVRQNPYRSPASTAHSGMYTLVVNVPGCSPYSTTTLVSVNELPQSVNITKIPEGPVCEGGLVVFSVPQIAGGKYSWIGPGFTESQYRASIDNVSTMNAGRVSVTVSVEGCPNSKITSTSLVVNPKPRPSVSNNSPICSGNTLLLTANNPITATYSWAGPGFSSTQQNPRLTNMTADMSGDYVATISVEGCEPVQLTTKVIVNQPPLSVVANSNSPVCTGQRLDLSVIAPNDADISWAGPNQFQAVGASTSMNGVTLSARGTYSATVTVAGCTPVTAITSVTVRTTPTLPAITSNSPVCEGLPLELSVNSSQSFAYEWTAPDGSTYTGPSFVVPMASGIYAGDYQVFAYQGNCTSGVAYTTVSVASRPGSPRVNSNSPVCTGGTLQLSANTIVNGRYYWQGPNGFSAVLQNPFLTNATTAATGEYSLTVIVNGCSSDVVTMPVTVHMIVDSKSIISNSPVCEGDAINFSADNLPGASYKWIGPSGFYSTLPLPSLPVAARENAGPYEFISVVNGCSTTRTIQVVVNALPAQPQIYATNPICAGGTLQFSTDVVQNATYLWSGPQFSSNRFSPAIGLVTTSNTGVYSLKVVVAGCTSASSSKSINVGSPDGSLISGAQTICAGNTTKIGVQLLGQGPWTVEIEPGIKQSLGSGFDLTPAIFELEVKPEVTTNYRLVAVTDASGCKKIISQSASVTVLPLPTLQASNNGPKCGNETVAVSAAANNTTASFLWTGPNNFTASTRTFTISNLDINKLGTYSVIAIANGCTSVQATTEVAQSSFPSANVSGETSVCVGKAGILLVNFTGKPPWSISYLTNNANPQTISGIIESPYVLNITPTSMGLYTITLNSVKDANGCLSSGNVAGSGQVRATDRPTVTIAARTDAGCGAKNGSLRATATGGTNSGFVYSIDGVNFTNTSGIFQDLAAGSYTVYVKDGNCTNATAALIGSTQNTTITNTSATSTTITVAWQALPGVAGYNIRYKAANSTTAYSQLSNLITTSTMLQGLTPGTTYEIAVQAICLTGQSGLWSPSVTATTVSSSSAGCDIPGKLAVSRVTQTTATASWNSAAGAVCYILSYGPLNTNVANWTPINIGGATLSTISGLTPGKQYGVYVRTNCTECSAGSGTRSPWTTIVPFTTLSMKESEWIAEEAPSIYPNPNTGQFSIHIPTASEQTVRIEVANLLGQVVKVVEQKVDSDSQTLFIEGSEWAKGAYLVNIKTPHAVYQKKIVIH